MRALALPARVAFALVPCALNLALCKLLQKLDNPLSKLSLLQSTRLSMSKEQPIPPIMTIMGISMLAQGLIFCAISCLMACKAAWHKRLKRRFVLKKKKRLLRIRRRTHDPVSEESAWEPPSPDCWVKSWITCWKDPKGQTWELLSS